MSRPIFHVLAGPNGAGKSTLYRALVVSGAIEGDLEFVKADLYEREHLQHIAGLQKRSEAARDWADARRETLLDAEVGFVSETVFSHESKLGLVSHAQALGYRDSGSARTPGAFVSDCANAATHKRRPAC